MFPLNKKEAWKVPLPKLFKWFLKWFFLLFSLSCFFVLILFYSLFQNSPSLFLGFVLGGLFSFLFALYLFIRLLDSLARVVGRTERIKKGERQINNKVDPFLDDEQGELYDLNKNLSHIHNHLRWQNRIISQESSELEAVISALTGAILAIDESKKILFFNNQATLLFSPKRRLQKKDLYLSELVRNPDILQLYSECLKTGQVIQKSISFSIFEMEEEPSIYEITIAPFKTKNQKIRGAVAFFYDITNIRNTEKIQSDFITNVSHELRTPLTAIQGYVEVLLDQEESNRQSQKFLGIIKRNVERLVSLLNHFLDMSQMEESVELKKDLLDTEEVTYSIIKDLHIKRHEVKVHISQKKVQADRHFLKQILYNLIENAVKYTPEGSLIEVFWERQLDQSVLKVKDNGPGVSPRHKSRLFEKFYRIDPSRSEVKGAGIGLSIVKQLIEKHGGCISLESKPGQGSVFICSFPMKED